jgi:hypothetical protein
MRMIGLARTTRKRGPDCSRPEPRARLFRDRGHAIASAAGVPESRPRERVPQSARGAVLELVGAPVRIVDQTEESERKVRRALERNRNLGKGLKVGKSFEVPGADGVAWYELTRVGVTSVQLEWRDYGRDLCMDEMFGAGGEFPRSLVERLTHRHDVLQELFQSLD